MNKLQFLPLFMSKIHTISLKALIDIKTTKLLLKIEIAYLQFNKI